MNRNAPTKFGLFFPPMHYARQNPTRAIHRDIETIEYADALGYDEAWVGEHHSSGHEIIGAPEVFLATAIGRTSRIKLGTGVASLPYHHPFHVAERAVMLDHLSMGRTMLGVGPGSLPTDAKMLGIPWSATRPRFTEAIEAVYRLLNDDGPVTMKTDWFTLEDAQLQLLPFTRPTMELVFTAMESPFGPTMAGRYGGGLISLGSTTPSGFSGLEKQWSVTEEQAEKHGKVVNRQSWRALTMIHVAETREKARQEVAVGFPHFVNYLTNVGERDVAWMSGDGAAPAVPPTTDEIIDGLSQTHVFCIGTPDDAIAMIQNLIDHSGPGGVGTILIYGGTDWAAQDATFRSLELFAREVMPAFQGSYAPLVRSMEGAMVTREAHVAEQRASVVEAQKAY